MTPELCCCSPQIMEPNAPACSAGFQVVSLTQFCVWAFNSIWELNYYVFICLLIYAFIYSFSSFSLFFSFCNTFITFWCTALWCVSRKPCFGERVSIHCSLEHKALPNTFEINLSFFLSYFLLKCHSIKAWCFSLLQAKVQKFKVKNCNRLSDVYLPVERKCYCTRLHDSGTWAVIRQSKSQQMTPSLMYQSPLEHNWIGHWPYILFVERLYMYER